MNTLDRHSAAPDLSKAAESKVTRPLHWVPLRIDMDMPHPARMHDYWLGGGHNFAADRAMAEKILQWMPGIEDVARLNQSYLRRATLLMVDQGIRQFLDIGSGIPTVGSPHEIAQRAAPECRFVYIESDPVGLAHSRLILNNVKGTEVIRADVRDVDGILQHEAVAALLDVETPIGLIAPMMHFIPDVWDPAGIIAGYRDRFVPGSFLALAHVTADAGTPGLAETVEAYQALVYSIHPRPYAEVLRMCAGFDLVEPGLVGFGDWRPDGPGDRSTKPGVNSLMYVAVGRKPTGEGK